MRVLVVGLATTGIAVVEYARVAGHDVGVLEDRPGAEGYPERRARAETAGARIVESPDRDLAAREGAAAELVVPSDGVRPYHPALVAADHAGVPVRSEIDLAAARLRARPNAPRLVAVTGTNGKTTVTTLADRMLREAGIASTAAGNIGRPLLEAAGDDVAVVVAEVSSFQLHFTSEAWAPDVAVLLNVAPDHLDWHGSFDAYAADKARVFAHQGPGGVLVVDADDDVAWSLARSAPGRVVPVSAGPPAEGGWGVAGGELVGPAGAIGRTRPRGAAHEAVDALAAAAAAVAAGGDPSAAARALDRFDGLAHRVRLVGTVDGVDWFDDSKATNPHATASALRGFDRVVLLAGGRNKDLDLGALRAEAAHLRAVVAIGEAAPEVEDAFAGVVPVTRAGSMRDAVRAAAGLAQPGDVVLLSPACASFDWYRDYAERGDDFAREVARLGEGQA